MNTFLLFILDVVVGAVAYFIYLGVFIPAMKKNELYAKILTKERMELEKKLGLEQYFGIKVAEETKIKKQQA